MLENRKRTLLLTYVIIHQNQCFYLFPQAMVTEGGKMIFYLVFHILYFHTPMVQYTPALGLVFNLGKFIQVIGIICFPSTCHLHLNSSLPAVFCRDFPRS